MIKQVEHDLDESIINDLLDIAKRGRPEEVCGIIQDLGVYVVRELPNTFDGDKAHGFDMKVTPDMHDIRYIWHSHPGGMPSPSRDDIPCMEVLAKHGHTYPWLIITDLSVTAWAYDLSRLIAKADN